VTHLSPAQRSTTPNACAPITFKDFNKILQLHSSLCVVSIASKRLIHALILGNVYSPASVNQPLRIDFLTA
jgi:hypothetical protein